jgi:hypothetical protein
MADSDRRGRALYNCVAWGLFLLEYRDMRLKTALLMISLLAAGSVMAQSDSKPAKMYKWTDENGTVHYSATPQESVPAEEVAIRSGPRTPAVAAVAAAPDPEAVARCEQMRSNLRLLESAATELQIEDNGKIRPMSAEEREPQLKATRAALERCKDVPPPAQ